MSRHKERERGGDTTATPLHLAIQSRVARCDVGYVLSENLKKYGVQIESGFKLCFVQFVTYTTENRKKYGFKIESSCEFCFLQFVTCITEHLTVQAESKSEGRFLPQ